MGELSYIFDDETHEKIRRAAMSIHDKDDRNSFRGEVVQELWDFMPFNRNEISKIIMNVYRKYHNSEGA